MVYAAVPEPSRRVEMQFDGPGQQRRWTVLVRFILAIPQAIVLGILQIALLIVAIIGWFGALFMGRLPVWVHQFNSGYTRWYMRYLAYVYLLTDEYPPFEFDDLPYPARPILPPPGSLNRLAVFFRLLLVFPAAAFQTIVMYGLFVPMLFVNWLIMVVTGRMPEAMYSAYSSWLRYQARVFAYTLLLTPEYPWGMLGDRAGSESVALPMAAPDFPAPYAPPAPFAQPSAPRSTTDAGTVGAGAPSGAPREDVAPAAAPAEPVWPPPPPPNWTAPPPSAPYPQWSAAPPPPPPGADAERNRLVLSPGGRKWVIFAIVWGSILLVAYVSILSAIGVNNANNRIRQHNTIVNDFNQSKALIEAVGNSRCTTLSCLHPSLVAAATSLEKFDADLETMNLPPNAQGPAQSVESDLTQLANAFTALANSPNAQAYRSTVQSSNLESLISTLPGDTNNLLNALDNSI